MTEFCASCGQELPVNIRQMRHRTTNDMRTVTCNRTCEVNRRKKIGLYKQMSQMGKSARSAAVTVSNHLHPRRRSQK
jgi:hypothetical protein